MTQNKKVNAQNAFEVDLNCLDNIKEFVAQQTETNKWVRSGDIIDAGTKIYGFRVDNVHAETYRMLHGMTRNAAGDQELEIVGAEESDGEKDESRPEGESKDEDEKKKKAARKIKFTEGQGDRTLEKP